MRFTLSASWFSSRDSCGGDATSQVAGGDRLGGGGRLAQRAHEQPVDLVRAERREDDRRPRRRAALIVSAPRAGSA